MKKFDFVIRNLDELPEAGSQILAFGEDVKGKVFAFHGPMGSGKTTLIKEICKSLGSVDNFSSPTYSIVNEYLIEKTGTKIFHMDLYRLRNFEEALALGIEEYLEGTNYCFIEWPELIDSLLPPGTVHVSIKPTDDMREFSIFNR